MKWSHCWQPLPWGAEAPCGPLLGLRLLVGCWRVARGPDVGGGRGMPHACWNRTPCLLPAACLPLSPAVWVGRAKMKKKKTNPAGYSLAFQGGAGAPRRRERPGADREGLGNIASDFFYEYFLNFKLHLHKPGYSGKQITLGKLDSKSSVQSLL